LAADFSVTQPTISRIKTGKMYPEVPWPNGATGRMPRKDAALADSGWSNEALAYMKWPEDAREMMLNTVNTQREAEGRFPIPSISVEWEVYMNSPSTNPAEEAEQMITAQKGEDERRAQVFREFQAIVDRRLTERQGRRVEETAAAMAPHHIDSADLPPPPKLTPGTYDKMSWGTILQTAPTVPIVRKILATRDTLLMEAVCIIFHEMRNTPNEWGQPYIEAAARDIRASLEAEPDGAEAIRKENAQYFPTKSDN